MSWKILDGPMWFQWVRPLVFLPLFAEYMRLAVTTDVASYRVAVCVGLGSTERLISARKQPVEW